MTSWCRFAVTGWVTLVHWPRWKPSAQTVPDLAFAATGGSLLNRVRRLVGKPGDGKPATLSEWGGIILLAAGVLLVATGVCWNLQPTVYTSSARLRLIDPVEMGIQRTDYSSEIETLRSDTVLAGVSDELSLASKWGVSKAKAVERLRGRIQVDLVPGGTQVDLRVLGHSPKEASEIANEIGEVYRKHRFQVNLELINKGIKALDDRKREHDALWQRNRRRWTACERN